MFQKKIDDLYEYYYLALWQGYEEAGNLCYPKFGIIMTRESFEETVESLNVDLEDIKKTIKEELHEV